MDTGRMETGRSTWMSSAPSRAKPMSTFSHGETSMQAGARVEAWIQTRLSGVPPASEQELQVYREALEMLVGSTSGFLKPLLVAIHEEYEARLTDLREQVQVANALKKKVAAADTESRSVVDRISRQRDAEQKQVENAEQNVGKLIRDAKTKMAQAHAEEQAHRDKIKELQAERRSMVDQLKLIGSKTQALEEEHEAKQEELSAIERDIEGSSQLLEQLQRDCATAVPKDSHKAEITKLDEAIAKKQQLVEELTNQLAAKERLLTELTDEIDANKGAPM
eukprot:TRINITY_DN26016_c0_g1_i1.p1 TRINITY_DN26016_c0_g1~~TRINITY_DN26016_c0_g1_i1.p1  ORF type:complete len:279 (+),score=80.14 TRINITY_DN26016_c0_g1_i1:230-1066(+)